MEGREVAEIDLNDALLLLGKKMLENERQSALIRRMDAHIAELEEQAKEQEGGHVSST